MLRCEEEFDDDDYKQTFNLHHNEGFSSRQGWQYQQRSGSPISEGFDRMLVEVTLNYLLREEHHFHVDPRSWLNAQGQHGIQPWMRPPVIEWMSQVSDEYELACLPLAISILDRYLSSARVAPADLQLHGAAALMIASKLKDEEPPTLGIMCACADHHFDQESLKTAESLILHKLEWRLQSICADEIFEHLLFMVIAVSGLSLDSVKIRKYGTLLTEMALLDFNSLQFYPSVIACAALVYAIELVCDSHCDAQRIIQSLCKEAGAPLDLTTFDQCKARVVDAFHELMKAKKGDSPRQAFSAPIAVASNTHMPAVTNAAREISLTMIPDYYGDERGLPMFDARVYGGYDRMAHTAYQTYERPACGHAGPNLTRNVSLCSINSDTTLLPQDEGFVGSFGSQDSFGSLSSYGSRADSAVDVLDSAVHSRSATPEEEPIWINYEMNPCHHAPDPIALSRGPTPTNGEDCTATYVRTSAAKRRRPNGEDADLRHETSPLLY